MINNNNNIIIKGDNVFPESPDASFWGGVDFAKCKNRVAQHEKFINNQVDIVALCGSARWANAKRLIKKAKTECAKGDYEKAEKHLEKAREKMRINIARHDSYKGAKSNIIGKCKDPKGGNLKDIDAYIDKNVGDQCDYETLEDFANKFDKEEETSNNDTSKNIPDFQEKKIENLDNGKMSNIVKIGGIGLLVIGIGVIGYQIFKTKK